MQIPKSYDTQKPVERISINSVDVSGFTLVPCLPSAWPFNYPFDSMKYSSGHPSMSPSIHPPVHPSTQLFTHQMSVQYLWKWLKSQTFTSCYLSSCLNEFKSFSFFGPTFFSFYKKISFALCCATSYSCFSFLPARALAPSNLETV